MAVHVCLKTDFQCSKEFFTLSGRQLFFVALNVSSWCCSHSRRFPRFFSVAPLRSATLGFCRLVLAFLSTRSFHAVRSAPVSTSSLAAARRICVCPIFPQPPGIGRKISGASSTNAACCSSVSIRFPYPPCLRGQRSKFPASYTKSRQSCVGVLFHALQAQRNPAKICCGHRVTPYITEYLTII